MSESAEEFAEAATGRAMDVTANFEQAKEMARRVMLAGSREDAVSASLAFENGWKAELSSTTASNAGRGSRQQLITVTHSTGGNGYDGPLKTHTMLAMSPEALRELLGPEQSAAELEASRDMLASEIADTIETLVRGDELPVHDAEALLQACRDLRKGNLESRREIYREAVARIMGIVEQADVMEENHLPPNPNPLQGTIDRLQNVLDAGRRGETV